MPIADHPNESARAGPFPGTRRAGFGSRKTAYFGVGALASVFAEETFSLGGGLLRSSAG